MAEASNNMDHTNILISILKKLIIMYLSIEFKV